MITKNAIRCKHCGDVVESKYGHDYVKCSCGAVAADGGKGYLRRTYPDGKPEDHYTELSTHSDGST